MKKQWIAAALAGWMLTASAAFPESAIITQTAPGLPEAEGGRITLIPVDQNSMKEAIAPHEESYLFDPATGEAIGYSDPSITVSLARGRIYDTGYLYARVKIATPSQLRTLLASPINNMNTTPGHDLAKRVRAVIAINGDYPGGDEYTKRTKGALMRQGQLFRLKCNEKSDVLVIDQAGDMHILQNAKDEDVEPLVNQAVNIFTFGPALIVDSVPNYDYPEIDIGPHKPAQRMAICQTGPLEYLLITCEGPENPGSVGLTIDQFIDLIASFPEVQNAYNLDGGSSCTMVFRLKGKNWQKVNALSSPKVRPLKDIIYFATAWEPGE